jgi:hypothetical protein
MYMFRSWGGYTINVSIGMDPFPPYAKEFQFDIGPGTAFGSAVGWLAMPFPVPVRARNVVAQPTGPCGGSWRELAFCGRLFSVAAPSPLPSPVPAPPRPQLKMLLGANDFCWVKMENMSAIGALREYNDWSFNERAPGVFASRPLVAMDVWLALSRVRAESSPKLLWCFVRCRRQQVEWQQRRLRPGVFSCLRGTGWSPHLVCA